MYAKGSPSLQITFKELNVSCHTTISCSAEQAPDKDGLLRWKTSGILK